MANDFTHHLFISPHLDDVVLSCGGTLHQLAARGDSVTVMTVMAGDPPDPLPDTLIIRDLHQRWRTRYNPVKQRRQEDRLALTHLGVTHEHMLLQDCVYRFKFDGERKEPFYPTEESLWEHVHPDDPTLWFLRSTQLPPDVTLYLPLGVGRHVDHLIVRDWGLSLMADPQLALIWYAEYPYIRQPGALEAALAAFAPRQLQAELCLLDEADIQAKTEAIACYQSQLSTFWDSSPAMENDVRETLYQTGHGRPAEQFWRILNASDN